MTNHKFDYRKAYKQMLREEAGMAPVGAMTSTGANSAYGATGDGTSATIDATSSVGSAKIMLPLSKKNMKRILDSSCKKVQESCDNCQCEKCKANNEKQMIEACKKHLKEFFGEGFEIGEYNAEGCSTEDMAECYTLTISKTGTSQEQTAEVCPKCNTEPCKCPKEPVQGTGDPNLIGQPIQQ